MKTTRRRFVQTSAIAGAGLLIAGRRAFGQTLDPIKNLRKFVAPLPGLGPSGIPVATPDTTRYPGVDYYRIVLGQYTQQLHPDLPPTTLWGYADAGADRSSARFRYLGPAIVAEKGRPTRVTFINNLPPKHPLPVDRSLPGADMGAVNRASVHLHGGFVPWPSDGGPFAWKAPSGAVGESHVLWLPDDKGRLTDDFWFPNQQSARLLWYHDHAMGITRLNAYAGLAAPYVIVDADDVRMFGSAGTVLPGQLPGIPLVLQEKSLKSARDRFGRPGDLDYPIVGEQDPDYPGGVPDPLPFPSCVPEFFGDTIIINGMAYPQLTLPAGPHRFRILNGTQARVFNLQLYREDSLNPGEADLSTKGPDFIQIGTEGGFLPAPAIVPSGNPFDVQKYHVTHDPSGYSLVLAGAERADLIIDFTGCEGASFILYNDAPAPFPFGDDAADYFTGSPLNPASGPAGYGPNTRTMMRVSIVGGAVPGLAGGALLSALAGELARVQIGLIVPEGLIGTEDGLSIAGIEPRIRTLNEGWDGFGRLIQILGTSSVTGKFFTSYGKEYMDDLEPDEQAAVGEVQIWDVYNATGDTHPIHFHLVNVQVLGRAPIAEAGADGSLVFAPTGPFYPPDPNERGWKETVRMNPETVTRVIMQFELPSDPVVNVRGGSQTVAVPASPRTGGHEYVWHCHILEHEEHDMMRPLVVK